MSGRGLPYRPCVGVALFDRQGRVWVGRRADAPNDEGEGHWWQMPQGGIDAGEDAAAAALRELREETGVSSARIAAEVPGWLIYDLPEHLVGKAWGGKYRGQKMKWFAARFTGDDAEIDLSGIGHAPEFSDWRWEALDRLPDLVVPFKRPVYRQLVAELKRLGFGDAAI